MDSSINTFESTVVPVVSEVIKLFPDGLVVASGIFALVTMSYPFGIFFGSMLEASVIFRMLRGFLRYTRAAGTNIQTGSNEPICRTGFSSPSLTLTEIAFFPYSPLEYSFPSGPIFSITTAASYIFTTLNTQSKELEALGPTYSSRYYVSAILLFVMIGIYATFRMLFSCDTFGNIIMTIPIGLIVGALLVKQNVQLFGQSSVNLLGIPLLRNRAANGKKLYVCPK